jgi:hypothetical protein
MTEKARIAAVTNIPNGARDLALLTLAEQPLE